MFRSIFIKTLHERRKGIAFWSLGLFAFALFVGLLYPSIDEVEGFETLVNDMPDMYQALIGEIDDITSPSGFLGAELYGLMLPLGLSILAISFGASAIAREEETGTIELLLATPTSRMRIIGEKVAALVAILIVTATATWAGVALSTALVEFNVNLWDVWWASLIVAGLALCFGLLALAVTAWGGKRGLAVGVMAAVFAISYFGNTLAVMVEAIESLRYGSLLYYYDGQGVVAGDIELRNLAILAATATLGLLLSIVGYKRRDIGT